MSKDSRGAITKGKDVFEELKKISTAAFGGRSIPVAVLLVLVALLSLGSGFYAGASFFPQQAPNVTITTTTFTTMTSWTTSTIWSTVTSVVYGVWTTVQYTTSTSTVTITGSISSRTAKSVTANGNARISTTQSKFGGASGLFDGSSSEYLSVPTSADFNFGSGDFTVDWWFRANTVTSDDGMFQLNSGSQGVLSVSIYSSKIYIKVSGGTNGNYGNTLTANTWHHFAIVRSGNTMTFYTDGSSIYSFSCAGWTFSNGGNPVWIGQYVSGAYSFSGYLDEFRISKGIARWTNSFTPSAAAYTNDGNTVLLLHMDGADGSSAFIDDVTSG